MRPIGAPEPKPGRRSKAPPNLLLKVLCRVHPELRRRARAAQRAIDRKMWNEDRLQWEHFGRAELLVAGRALQAEPIEQLDDEALTDHLRRAADHLERGIGKHFELLPIHNLTVGRLLLACRGWGIDPTEAFALLAGTSPASTASAARLAAIARALDCAGVEPRTLDDVRNASPDAAAALDDYLADHGWRVVTQYSPSGIALIELPGVLLHAIGAASKCDSPPPIADASAVRERVPTADQARFDDLLADARACYGVRDDNVALTIMWPSGLVRRALLEAGRRLANRGILRDATHVFALGEAEIAAALAGDATLGAEAAARTARIEAAEADGAPAQLGDDEGPPPDPSVFPAPVAELLAAILMEFELEQAFKTERVDAQAFSGTGTGLGTAPYTGRACVAASAAEALAQLQPGDILVTSHTTPAFEAIMPIAGALVTDFGGLMSHAALVCREYGIPAVIGVAGATTHIVNGEPLTVDPIANRVLVPSSHFT
jgi:pyruvate,water dikinase